MKKYMVWTMLLVLLVAGCGNMSTWVMTGQDTDLTTRIGMEAADGVEVGLTAKWDQSSGIEWGPEPEQIGPYAILTASWLIEQDDTGPAAPVPVSWLDGLVAVPYAGVDFVDDVDNGNFSNLEPNWIVGTKFLLDSDGNAAIVVEYVDGDQTRSDVNVGMMARF